MRRHTGSIAIAFSAILLLALAPARAPAQALSKFGRTTVGATPSAGLRVDFKRGSKFVLPQRAAITSICAYLDTNGGGTGTQWVRFALYRDQNGIPAQQILETDQFFGLESAVQPPEWYCGGTANAPLEPGSYWMMIHTGGDPGVIRYFHDGPANWYGNADQFADGASDTFGTGAAGTGTLSIYVEYLPESEAHYAGPRNVGTRVSSPMSAQMKRGSSLVLTEPAQIWSLNAYVDSQGGTVGSQPLTIAVYTDKNGEPFTLVAGGSVSSGSLTNGRTARWVSSSFVGGNTLLTPGRYWIVLLTGSPAGVLRYYMTGTGNWRGNANPGQDPSPFFGAANAGDGTITANVLYTPANIAQHTFGQTTPGNIPSGALTANFVRGSEFTADVDLGAGWVTALWAYMDGNGGASGSQKVRLALYEKVVVFSELRLMTQSEEVTIPAGTPPGWVRFAVPHTHIEPSENFRSYHIMMFSGGTQGVARYYLSNDADNWLGGGPVAYPQIAPPNFLETSADQGIPGAPLLKRGTRTVSVYAEYVNDTN
jgi:hypothetical protein